MCFATEQAFSCSVFKAELVLNLRNVIYQLKVMVSKFFVTEIIIFKQEKYINKKMRDL